MITHLHGRLAAKTPPFLVVDVGGVGYEVEAPMSTFYALGDSGTEVELLTQMVVREDAQLLYGFATVPERDLFRLIVKVNGVGPRLALAVLSALSVSDFHRALLNDDVAMLVRVPGIGKKTAQRILVDLRDANAEVFKADSASGAVQGDAKAEAGQALSALGYKPADVERMLAGMQAEGQSVEALIREALRARS